MMSSEEDTKCFGLYDKLLIKTNNSEKNKVGVGRNSFKISNSNSNSNNSSIISISNSSSITNKKCNRQLVDAGDQKNNSYSAIPNFSFRPSSFMSNVSTETTGLYTTLINQTQSAHFVGGLFGPNGFGSSNMLNEILGRQMKQAQDATSGIPTSLVDDAMLTAAMETATSVDLLSASISSNFNSSKVLNNSCRTQSGIGNNASVRGGSDLNKKNDSFSSNLTPIDTGEHNKEECDRLDESESVLPKKQQQIISTQEQHKQQQNSLAHHMLRNILQGKKELIALDQELRSVINHQSNSENLIQKTTAGGSDDDFASLSKNNLISISKNNSSAKNNNKNDNTNKTLGNTCENRSTLGTMSNKARSITHLCSKSSICNLIGSVDELMNTLGSCSDAQIKSEPKAPTTPTVIENAICNLAERNNNCNSSSLVSTNGLRHRRKSSENLSTDEHAADSEGFNELNLSEMQQPNEILQSECRSLINAIVTKKEAEDLLEDEMIVLSSRSNLESRGSSTHSDMMQNNIQEEAEEHEKIDDPTVNTSVTTLNPIIVLDIKRARVENIVSSMQSSPSSQNQMNLQVNGCKKRKLYQPQQHAMERYAAAAAGLNFGLNMQSLILEEEDEEDIVSPQIQQKRVQKNALKSQLRTMQEQLAEMQQKYVQLCSRMEQESESQELDDTASNSMDNEGNHGEISPGLSLTNSTYTASRQRPLSTSPPLYSTKPKRHASASVKSSNGNTPKMLAEIMNKIITAKIHSPALEQSHLQQTYGSKCSLLQNKTHVPEEQNSNASHPVISNAAAMYLGQHLLLEHEVRIAKENAEQHERQLQHQQLLQQQQKEQQQTQHEHQRFRQEEKEAHIRQKEHQHQHQRQQNQQKEAQHHRHFSVDARQAAASVGNHIQASHSHQRSHQPHQDHMTTSTQSSIKSEISEKFNMLRSHSSSTVRMSGSDLEGLADILKSEITTSLTALVDTIVTRFVHQRRLFNKKSQSVAVAADQFNKDLMMASHILERKSPRIKEPDQLPSNSIPTVSASLVNTSGNSVVLNLNKKQTIPINSSLCNISSTISSHPSNSFLSNHFTNSNGNNNCSIHIAGPRTNSINLAFASPSRMEMQVQHTTGMNCTLSQLDKNSRNLQPHLRSSPSAAIFQAPKTPQNMGSVAAVSIYNSIGLGGSGGALHKNPTIPFSMSETREQTVEQNEALSLVVTPKKKRHKVTDTRITPRTVSRILAQDIVVGPTVGHSLTSDSNHVQNPSSQQNTFLNQNPPVSNSNVIVAPTSLTPSKNSSPLHIPYQPPAPPIMAVSLPTSVAVPNPSLHESQVFSPYSPFFNPHHELHGSSHLPPAAAQMHHMKISSSPPGLAGMIENRDSPPIPHAQTMLHPALLAAVHHGNSPDYSAHLRAAMDAQDRNSDCNSADIQFDGIQPTISFLKQHINKSESLTPLHSSTLTPMHLRKAKLMFFWVRYPSSAVLKMYFPDIKFNKNNTAQLVKWFSNFRFRHY